jgi:tol-pal system protein YbgF
MMKPLARNMAARLGMAGALASAMLFAAAAPAQDSRLSLADRVTRLEQQAQSNDQGGIAAVNQMEQLRAQLRQMQGQIEELQHHLQDLEDKSKAQYTDIDSRLGRLESGHAGAGSNPAVGGTAPTTDAGTPGGNPGASMVAASNGPAVASTAAGGATDDPATVQAAYDVAFKTLRGGDYVQASRQFRSFIKQYPNDTLTSNAWYWLGESYYVTMNYPVALESFQHLLSQFPQSEKAPDAMLKVGYCQLELKQMRAAKTTLSAVAAKYPGSKAASLAQERLQRIRQQSAN